KGGGFLVGDTIQMITEDSNGTAVEAIPVDGYQFVEWSDGKKDNPRAELNVKGNIEIQALFSIATDLNSNISESIKLYPNPTKDVLNIESVLESGATFRIFMTNGAQVKSGIIYSNKNTIDLS